MTSEIVREPDGGRLIRWLRMLFHAFRKPEGTYAASITVVAASILIVDLSLPLGVAAGVPYILVVLLAARTGSVRWTIATATICTALIGIGYLASPSGGEAWKVVSNRLLAVLAVWVTGILTVRWLTRERTISVELARLNEERTRFLSNVSHELKTPLTSVLAFADVLSHDRDKTMSERQLQQLTVMRRGARRLDVLINDLLDVSRMDAGKFVIEKLEFDAKTVLDDVNESWTPILESKQQTLAMSYPKNEIWLTADKTRVIQVITNLLSNASKYSEVGSEISITIEVEQDELALAVRDRGVGLSEQALAALFTPFFRVDNVETRSESGTGLGLVIVKTIVESHGGEISVASEMGTGSTFTVKFPNCADAPSEHYLRSRPTNIASVISGSRLE
ncbi:MAG: HAMP domain-containing histidine kinase [Chloroflexi bacterium]|nr:HAMP domain-containing histidine kinase [Chloroflexota bacterium]